MRRMNFGRYDYAAFLSFFSYAAGSVVVPVALVALADDLDFALDTGGMGDAGLLHLGRTVAMVGAMLLCGFLAGQWGKRLPMGGAVALMAVGVLLCAVAPAYGIVFVGLFIAGLGEGVVEGLGTPFVQALHPEEPGRYINFAHSFWSIGVLVAVLVSGALISLGVSWRVPVAATSLLALAATLVILLRQTPGREYPEPSATVPIAVVWGHARDILRTGRFWVYFAAMFFAGGGEFCLTFWCASYIQLNFVNAAWAGGVGTACFAGGMFLGRVGGGYLIRQHQLKALIVGSALAGVLLTLLLPWVTNLWALLGLLFVTGLASAPYWPSVQSYAADRMPASDSTMLFILLSCAGVPGCGVCTWLMGYLGDRTGGLRLAFLLVPACYFALLLLVALDGFKPRKSPVALSDGLNT